MTRYDTIVEVEKNIDEIVEVEKFNPFHDSAGKFSSSNGFKTYSANPNTRAGAMAIARSAAAGHGNTMNVHRQSYGENIRQNANWLGRGKQQSSRQQGNATLRSRVEPSAGLAGASATGASWQYQNQQQGRTTRPSTKPQPKQQSTSSNQNTNKPTPKQAPQNQQQAAQTTQQQSQTPNHTIATGKDISKNLISSRKSYNVNEVADMQGFRGKPKVVSQAEFDQAVKDSGFIAYRTIRPGKNVVTGKQTTSSEFADIIKNGDSKSFSLNGSGGQCYGGGLYIAATQNPKRGTVPSKSQSKDALDDSHCYGKRRVSTTVSMTLDPSAKVGDYASVSKKLQKDFSAQATFGNDVGAYAASLGYDALKATNAGYKCDYITVYNRTKLIVRDQTDAY